VYKPNLALGLWVFTQRRRRRILSAERRRRLTALGFEWRLRDMPAPKDWGTWFRELRAFRLRSGHCRVTLTLPRNRPLGRWVRWQRRIRWQLSPEQRRKLAALGFDWAPIENVWERRFAELKAYRARYGHCHVPQRWPKNVALSYWVVRQRRYWRARRLSREQCRRLSQLGFWDPQPHRRRKRSARKRP
jgi:hypothetical protein